MEGYAKLISAIGSFLAAILWPTVFATLAFVYRSELRIILKRLPALLDRIRKVKGFGFDAELDALAANAPATGEITPEQQRAATQLAVAAQDIGLRELQRELDGICLKYDTIRRNMQAGPARTREMTRVIVKMRAIGPSVSQALDIYKGSGSAGSRLAAVAMMQMEPTKADIAWLAGRFSNESPFIFYHAALALTNAATISVEKHREAATAARTALDIVQAFDGEPDQETVKVLTELLCSQ